MTDSSHDQVREALLDVEPQELPESLKQHFDGCAECRAFHGALFAVDEGLGALPLIEAPLDLISRTQFAVEELPRLHARAPETAPAPVGMIALFGALLAGLFSGVWALVSLLAYPFKTRRRLAIAIPAFGALGLVFVVGLGAFTFTLRGSEEADASAGLQLESLEAEQRSVSYMMEDSEEVTEETPTATPTEAATPTSDTFALDSAGEMDSLVDELHAVVGGVEDAPPPPAPVQDPAPNAQRAQDTDGWEDNDGDDRTGDGREAANGRYYGGDELDSEQPDGSNDGTVARFDAWGYRGERERVDLGVRGTGQTGEIDFAQRGARVTVDGQTADEGRRVVDLPRGHHQVELLPRGNAESAEESGQVALSLRNGLLRQQLEGLGYADGTDEGGAATVERGPRLIDDGEGEDDDGLRRVDESNNRFGAATTIPQGTFHSRIELGDARRAANDLASERDRHQGLTFRSPTGYWANTYLPGDPAVRSLRRRLADHPAAVQLAEIAQPGAPGLSPPRTGALSLDVSADRTSVEGRSRVLMSVGLRGAAQRAGRRPSLRAQVVLDIRRPLDADGEARVRALLSSVSRRRDGSDRVGVLVAGPDGGTRIGLGTMRFGEVSVALRRIFGSPPDGATPVSLRASLEQAIASIGQLDEDAPLGSSMVLLVTPGLTAADSQELARAAHTGALAGVTTTVIGLNDRAVLDPLERVALAGQGRRRILGSAGDADTLVRQEIAAVSRVVARAVRVRIRLAEGVQLVDVLGSRSLDEAQAQRVRRAEQAIDRVLARQLGITSDRGEDEDGIQIVVPAFYADDSHRVLLDVVVPGPGPVADVQVRFKDLLRLGNGTLTNRLVLSRGAGARGPAERAVFAAWLGHELSTALRLAAGQLDAGQPEGAGATLERARLRIVAAWDAIPELASEPTLSRDVSLCQRYRDALAVQPADVMSRSLRYAAHRRLLGDPLGLGGEP